MVANNINTLKVRLKEAMKERKVKFPELSELTGISLAKMYKWYEENTLPKANDAAILEAWVNGENSNKNQNINLRALLVRIADAQEGQQKALEGIRFSIDLLAAIFAGSPSSDKDGKQKLGERVVTNSDTLQGRVESLEELVRTRKKGAEGNGDKPKG